MRILFALFFIALAGCALPLSAQAKLSSTDSIKKFNRHDFVAKGNHPQELLVGNYIVVATTLSEADAEQMIKEYKKLKCPEPVYGYVSQKSLWYLGFDGEGDIEKARVKRNEVRKNKVFKDAWLLTIHK